MIELLAAAYLVGWIVFVHRVVAPDPEHVLLPAELLVSLVAWLPVAALRDADGL